MPNYIVTGISGSGRIALLNELKEEFARRGKTANVFDTGALIFDAARELKIGISEEKVLDVDRDLLVALRKVALDEVQLRIMREPADFNFIAIHATFRWKGRIISGVTYRELRSLEIHGMVNVIDNVEDIRRVNMRNPKWSDSEVPGIEETNNWIMEEEFFSEVLANFLEVPMVLVGRRHNIANLADLFLTDKPRIYLSYPITHIQEENPELLATVREVILPKLQKRFVVFDPMVVEDMPLVAARKTEGLPDTVERVSETAADAIKARTVERDFQFIDQSDFVVVIYLTEKVSPGVLSEIIYASRHNKPVFMVFPYARSPFLQEYATHLFDSSEAMLAYFDREEFKARFVKP